VKWKDHSFRNKKPVTYDVVIQMTYDEVDDLHSRIRANIPDIEYDYPESTLYQLWVVLGREIASRPTRKKNPGFSEVYEGPFGGLKEGLASGPWFG
jgi:hypothetical protein